MGQSSWQYEEQIDISRDDKIENKKSLIKNT